MPDPVQALSFSERDVFTLQDALVVLRSMDPAKRLTNGAALEPTEMPILEAARLLKAHNIRLIDSPQSQAFQEARSLEAIVTFLSEGLLPVSDPRSAPILQENITHAINGIESLLGIDGQTACMEATQDVDSDQPMSTDARLKLLRNWTDKLPILFNSLRGMDFGVDTADGIIDCRLLVDANNGFMLAYGDDTIRFNSDGSFDWARSPNSDVAEEILADKAIRNIEEFFASNTGKLVLRIKQSGRF